MEKTTLNMSVSVTGEGRPFPVPRRLHAVPADAVGVPAGPVGDHRSCMWTGRHPTRPLSVVLLLLPHQGQGAEEAPARARLGAAFTTAEAGPVPPTFSAPPRWGPAGSVPSPLAPARVLAARSRPPRVAWPGLQGRGGGLQDRPAASVR